MKKVSDRTVGDSAGGVIHIAPSLDYLFPDTVETATVLCGRLASEVFGSGEWIGISGNLNPDCTVCPVCCRRSREHPC